MTSTAGRRLFRTVLFTDIVGSTQLAAELGDRKWRRTVAKHNSAIRQELRRHHGREVDTAGDGFFAIFENPTDAVRCAAAAVAATHALGIRIRAGVHTGEVEPAGANFGGIAVHIGARLLGLAGPQEVLVSSTVRDLVAGSGHAFDDRGAHELKGVPGEWHVYSLSLPRFEEGVPLVGVDDEELRAVVSRRQRLLVGGLLVVIALLVAGLGAAFLLAMRPAAPVRGPDTLSVFDPGLTQPSRGLRVDRGPSAVAVGEAAYWSANTDAGTVSRVDVASGAVSTFGQAGTRPTAIALTSGRAWVIDRYSSRITILDGRQGTLLNSMQIHGSAISALGNQVWISDDLRDRVVRLDPNSGAELNTVELSPPAGPTDIAVTDSRVWIAAPRANAVLGLDPATTAPVDVPVGLPDVRFLSALGEDVWLVSPSEDRIARLDAASGRIAVTVDVCDTPVDAAATPTGVWVVCSQSKALWQVDRTGAVVSRVELDAVPTAVAADGERAVVSLRSD